MNIQLKQIIKYLNQKYPEKDAENWDKIGLVYGDSKKIVNNIMLALDLTIDVLDQAILNKCELIIVHHPFWFEKTKAEDLKKSPYKKTIAKRLINNGIGLYVMHTNYDNNKHGTSKQLMDVLNFESYKFLNNNYYGVIVQNHYNFQELMQLIKQKLNIKHFETNFDTNSKMMINQIAFLPGSGDLSLIIESHQKGAGLIFTSDIKWSNWITAQMHKIKLVNYSHSVEKVFVNHLNSLLSHNFKKIKVWSYNLDLKLFWV